VVYAFASSKLSYAALGQWNIASSQWVPFFALYLLKSGEALPGGERISTRQALSLRHWRYPLLAALFLILQAYAELTYASFLVLFTLVWALWRGWRALRTRRGAALPALGLRLAILGLVFLAGLAPVLAMMVPDLLAEGDIFVEGGGFADVFSADLVGFFVPTRLHPLFGSLVARFHFHHGVGQHIYVGYALLGLVAAGAIAGRKKPAARFWLVSALVFWLLTLGPTLRIDGHDTGLPMPFALVAQLPFFKGNRYPSRYSVLLFLSLAMLAAYGIHEIQVRSKRWRAGRHRLLPAAGSLLLTALFVFEHLSIPLPLSDMRVPPIYQAIREMPGDWTLLDLPVAWRNGFRVTGTAHPIIMFEQYYQSVHEKRLLAGNTSRNPPLKFQYFVEAPVIQTLIALETGHAIDPAVVQADRELAPAVLRFFDVRVVLVHPEAGPLVLPYVESTFPVTPLEGGDGLQAYEVSPPPWPQEWSIAPGEPLSRLSYAEGWGPAANGVIWAERRRVRLLVPLAGQAGQMRFRAYTPGAGQAMRVATGGWQSAPLPLAPGWHEYEMALPSEQGLNDVWLLFETTYPTGSAGPSARDIGDTGIETPVNLVVESAGKEVGDMAHIYVDGRDVSPGGRGYNVAVIHPTTGQVESAGTFDTHLDAGASQALAAFLQAVPEDRIVTVAAADEASSLLGPEAVGALHGIGAAGDLRERFRWGHAIIGVQGATPGTALEAMAWMGPARVVAGEPATAPEVAAAFGPITFGSAE
jgi:hypothetical protein